MVKVKNVLEIGPGIYPTSYAFDPGFDYLGIDPDMHYRVESNFSYLMDGIKAKRGTLEGFEYRRGQLIGDSLGSLACSRDLVVMSNVLGDRQSYKGPYTGLFYCPDARATRQTDIESPAQIISQALQCLRPRGKLMVIEDAIDSDNRADHMMPEEFCRVIDEDSITKKTIDNYKVSCGSDYLEKKRVLYPEFEESGKIPPGYFDTCFVAELHKTAG